MLLDAPLFSSYTLIGVKLTTVSRLANALTTASLLLSYFQTSIYLTN